MCVIVDLASRRKLKAAANSLAHPSGIRLPLDRPSDAELIAPEVRHAISSGAFEADVIDLLSDAVRDGDRVLVVGAGLGIVSTLVAQMPGVERIIAVEADAALAPYAQRVHAANGVPWVETLNAVVTAKGTGRVPFFSRRDLRSSSLSPEDGDWRNVMLVPMIDLNLILTEERISLVIYNLPQSPRRLLGHAALGSVERILVGGGADSAGDAGVRDGLAARGYGSVRLGDAVLFDRAAVGTRSAGPRTFTVVAG